MTLLTPLLLAAALHGSMLPPDNPPYVSPAMYLAWDDCFDSGNGGTEGKSFACDANTGESFRLVASVRPPEGLTHYVGSLCVFDLQSATPALPLWWQYGGCRVSTSLTVTPSPAATSCPDLESAPHFGGIDYNFTSNGPNRARLRTAFVIDETLVHPLDHSLEQTVLVITIDRRRTVGTGNCPGCSTPVCIVWTSILLDQTGGLPAQVLTTRGERYWATWQGPSNQVPCPAATPATTRTWGQLKSLYR